MIRSSSMLRDASAAVAVAVLALTVGLSAAPPAMADDGDTPPGLCLLNCPTEGTQPEEPGKATPGSHPTNTATPTTTPTRPPAEPLPAIPAVPAAPAPAPAPTVAPAPAVSAVQATPTPTPTPEQTTSTASRSASATPSAESNWDKPVTKPAKPTQAAAVSRNDGSGLFGSPGLMAIMAGVLLVGMAGLAFAWWGKNRFSSH